MKLTWDFIHKLVEECSNHLEDIEGRDILLARIVHADPRPGKIFTNTEQMMEYFEKKSKKSKRLRKTRKK
jgi:hypothetical protein